MLRLVLCIGLLLPLASVSASDPQPFLNLDFERTTPEGVPKGWRVGGRGYSVTTDTAVSRSGRRSLRFRRTSSVSARFASTVTAFPIDVARGTTLRISAWIKTHAVTDGYAGLWGRVEGDARAPLVFENMQGRGAEGTTDWTRYTLTLTVDPSATQVVFGALLAGDGTAWVDALTITVDGTPFPQTPPPIVRPSAAQVDALRDRLVPFDGVDPTGSSDDLEPVAALLGDARFVGLGEPTHGSREIVQFKHRLIRHLATTQDRPLVVALEASLPEARAVDRYVRTGAGSARDVVAELGTWTWRTASFVAVVEWLRAHAERGGDVTFAGVDVQAPTVAMDSVRQFVRRVDPSLTDAVDAAYASVDSVYNRRNRLSHDGPDAFAPWTQAAAAVLDSLSARQSAYRTQTSDAAVDWALQYARIVWQAGAVHTEAQSRDASMAQNADWFADRAAPDARLILWSHNAHVSTAPDTPSLGRLLREQHGHDYVAIGMTFYAGRYTAIDRTRRVAVHDAPTAPPGSAAWALHQAGRPFAALDLRRTAPTDPATAWLHERLELRSVGAVAREYGFDDTTLPDAFDALVYLERTTVTQVFHATR